jgi:predicted O-linked N-acetylglucosamine transferase (SPINDLY family)
MFAANPQAALDKVNRKIADIDANLSDLAAKRATLLSSLEDDSVSAVQSLDKAADAERAARVILADKAKALAEEVRKATYLEREQQRGKAIATIKQKLKKREETASDLQAAIARVGALYVELTGNDEVEQYWNFPRPGGAFARLDMRTVNRECSWAMYSICRGQRVPEPNSVGLGVIGCSAIGIDGAVRQQNESIISRLETAPIGLDLMDEAI